MTLIVSSRSKKKDLDGDMSEINCHKYEVDLLHDSGAQTARGDSLSFVFRRLLSQNERAIIQSWNGPVMARLFS